AGHKERYLIHPKIFYYSPKTSISFIGDINNQGKKSFTFKDYLEFEGGISKLLSNANSYFSLYNSDFANYLSNEDFKEEKQVFGAFNMRNSVSNNTDLSAYVISSKSEIETENQTINEYLLNTPFLENRINTKQVNNFFTIGKITLDYDPNLKTDYALTSLVKLTNTKSNGVINTNSSIDSNNIQTNNDIDAITLKQNFNLNKNISKKHTLTLDGTYHFQQDRPNLQWLTNQEILIGIIPLEDANIFNIVQTKKFNAHNINFNLKDYWSLHRFHHLYTSIGVNVARTNFFSEDVQQLDNGSLNNFNSAGFGNDFDYNFLDTYLGLEYKFKTGKVIFKPALFYHNYHWQTKQFLEKQNFNKNLFLPQFTTKIDFRNSEKLNLKYKLNASFPNTKILANNFILSNFNTVYRGNINLENNLYHTLNISYYKYNLYRGYNFYINTNLNKKIKSLKNTAQLEGIESINTQIMFNEPEQNWSTDFSFSKRIDKIRYKIKSNFGYNDFYQILNNEINKNISKTVSIEPSIATFFKKLPNLELGYKKDFRNYRSLGNTTKFENYKFYAFLEYDFLEDFILKADYTFDKYQNKSSNINNTFDNANASLFYQKEDNPWGFEITANNIFDTTFKQQNSFSNFLISDSKTFILPRVVMFKVVYKL
ncbi:MAG: carboxypeptidase regulatory-like domain-containing protein, partial [Flavobacteriaceae bacterium]|nr:carboxypeptidase regulatory-like domain-containing protein [Flavobacteriaceae bacterium]